MEYMNKIEAAIETALLSIDKTLQSTGYTYYTETGTVQIFDEILSIASNRAASKDAAAVNYEFGIEDSDGVRAAGFSSGQKSNLFQIVLVIKAKVHNSGVAGENPKKAIREKMNESFSDQLFLFNENYRLGGLVESFDFQTMTRVFEDVTNDRIQTGTVETRWLLTFARDTRNPDLKACI